MPAATRSAWTKARGARCAHAGGAEVLSLPVTARRGRRSEYELARKYVALATPNEFSCRITTLGSNAFGTSDAFGAMHSAWRISQRSHACKADRSSAVKDAAGERLARRPPPARPPPADEELVVPR